MGSRVQKVHGSRVLLACAVACAPRKARLPPRLLQPHRRLLLHRQRRRTAASGRTENPDERVHVCHNLREVTKFSGFYGREQWRDIVLTMMDYGAPVNAKRGRGAHGLPDRGPR